MCSPLNIEIAPYTSRIVQQLSTTATSVDTEFSMTNNTLIAPKRTATPTAANSNHQLQQYIPRETRSLQPHLLLSRFPKQQTYQIVIYYLQHASLEFMSNRALIFMWCHHLRDYEGKWKTTAMLVYNEIVYGIVITWWKCSINPCPQATPLNRGGYWT